MNREQLIAQLRDIQVPEPPADAVPLTFAAWPLVTLAAILALLAVGALWQRTGWRRDLAAALRRIDREPDPQARWRALEDLAARLIRLRGLSAPLPPYAYRDPARIGETEISDLRQRIRALARWRIRG